MATDASSKQIGRSRFALPGMQAIFVALPTSFGLLTFQLDYKRLLVRDFAVPVAAFEVALLVTLALWGLRLGKVLEAIPRRGKIAAALLFGTALIATFGHAPVPSTGINHLALTALHVSVAVAIWKFLGDTAEPRAAERLVLAMAGGIALFAGSSWITLFLVRDVVGFDWVRVGFGVSHVRHFSYLGVLAAGIGSGFLARAAFYRRTAIAAWAAVAVGWFLCVWSGSRAGVLSCIFAVILAIALRSGPTLIATASRLCSAAIAGVALSLVWIPPSDMWGLQRIIGKVQEGGASAGGTLSNRDVLWQEAWRLFRESPLVGFGEGQFRTLSRAEWPANHPHDLPLQLLVQWGAIGTLAATTLVLMAVGPSLRSIRNLTAPGLAALLALLAIGADSLVDGPLFYAMPTMMVLVLIAILAHETRRIATDDH